MTVCYYYVTHAFQDEPTVKYNEMDCTDKYLQQKTRDQK